jgi:hypothetical protein
MKRILCSLTIAAVMAAAITASAAFPEEVRQALRLCTADIQTALGTSGLPKDLPIAILPIKGDADDCALGILKNAATGAGLKCVEGKEDPFVQEVFKEIGWDERKDDILDAATLAKFGKLKAAKFLMYGVVRETSGGNGRGYAEIEVHVSSIETKQHLWGQVFARRFYNAPALEGLVDLDPNIRQLIQKSFEDKVANLTADPKLKAVKTIVIVPLGGDLGGYVTKLAESMLSKTQYTPKPPEAATLGQVRALLRDDPQAADAVLFGAVRDLSRKLLHRYFDGEEYEISSLVQVTIQDARTGNVLWSEAIEARGLDRIIIKPWEMVLRYHRYIIAAFSVLLVLVVLFVFFRGMRRAR